MMEGAQKVPSHMPRKQYQEYEDYHRDNTLKWFCHSCQDQDKGIHPKTNVLAWGKMKDKANQNKSQLGISKNCRMEKKLYANPKKKSWKNTNCKSVSSYTL